MAKFFDVQKAIQDGGDPAEIQQFMKANGLQPLPATTEAAPVSPPPQSQIDQAPSPSESTWDVKKMVLDSLPAAGAIGLGMVGGAAAGPFGAVPAAAAGSGLGEVLRQKLSGEKIDTTGAKKQALLGAAGEGVGNVIGAVAKPVIGAVAKKIPERLMNTVFKEPLKATKAAIRKGFTLGEEALNRGEIGGTEGIFKKAVGKVNELEDTLQNLLMDSKEKVSMSTVRKTVQPMIDQLKDAGNFSVADSITNRIDAIQKSVGKNIPVARANEIKRTIYDELRNAFGSQSSELNEGLKTIARSMKEQIGGSEAISQINKDLSYYGRIADSMTSAMSKSRNNIAEFSDILPVTGGFTVGGIPGGAAAFIGKKILGSTEGKTAIAQGMKTVGNFAQSLPDISGPIGQVVTRGANALAFGGLESPPDQVNNQGNQTQGFHTEDDSNTDADISQEMPSITGHSTEELAQAYTKAVMANDSGAAAQLKKLYDLQVAHEKTQKPKKQTEKQAFYGSAAESAQHALDLLEDNKAKTGLGTKALSGVKRITGKTTPEQQDFLSTLSLARGVLLNSLSGANVPPHEYERLKALLEIEDSSLEVAKQQLKTFIREAKRFSNQEVDSVGVTIPNLEMDSLPAIQ